MMYILKTNWQKAVSVMMVAALSACGVEPSSPDYGSAPDYEEEPAAEETHGQLALSSHTPERAAGTWSQGNTRFAFEATRSPSSRSFRMAEVNGPAKLTIVAHEAEKRLEINGRRVVLDPAGNGLALEGDEGLLAALGAMPEVAHLPELQRALRAANVDARLVELVPNPAFFGAPSTTLAAGRSALASTASCLSACEGQFAASMALVIIFAPWLIPSVVQIYTACVANCG